MRGITKIALLAAVAGALTVPVAAPASAHWTQWQRHHRHHHFVYRGHGAYAFAPRHWSASGRNERDCLRSPASLRFKPCMNKE
jgi:hypothetical protein